MLAITTPFPQFFDLSGAPLNAGSIYIGAPGENPVTNPISIFWDSLGSTPAPQPVRTINGFPARNGSPASIYVAPGSYSMAVKDKKGRQVFFSSDASLYSNSALLAGPSGGTYVSSKYPTPSSEVVSVAARLGETVSARFFGNKGAGSLSEYTAQVQNAANFAITQGGSIYFGQGVHEIGDITTTGALRIYGDGAGVTIIRLRGPKHRWQTNLVDQNDILIVEGVTFETDGSPEPTFNRADPNTALFVNYTLIGFDNRDGRRVFTNDVEFRGQVLSAHGWAVTLWMLNINGSVHINPWFRGIALNGTDDGAEASNTICKLCVQIDGAEYPTDHRFISATFYSYDLCINGAGRIEGITISEGVAVNVGKLLSWTPELGYGGRPGLKVINFHCNSYKGVVTLNGVQQAQLEGGEVYHNPGSASDWIAYELNSVLDVTLRGNGYFRYLDNASPKTSVAIHVSVFLSANIIVDSEIFGGFYTRLDVGVRIAADLSTGVLTLGPNCRWNGNYRVADIQNLGINAQVFGARTLFARRTNSMTASAVPTVIEWDTLLEDTTGLWPPAAGVFTVPLGRGIRRVRVTLSVMWDSNSTGLRQARVFRKFAAGGDSVVVAQHTMPSVSGGVTSATVTVVVPTTGGDTIWVDTLQFSGSTLNVTGAYTNLSIEILN